MAALEGAKYGVRSNAVSPSARTRIETSLQERGVPIQALHLLEDRSQLRHPMPLRGDLREHVFGTLTMDRPLTSARSLPQAAEAMRIGEP